jgi:HEXXH motif-containing protein
MEDSSNVRFTWPDGFTLTLPKGRFVEIERSDGARFWTLPSIRGVPVFNQVTEVSRVVAALEVCTDYEIQQGIGKVAEGLQFLGAVWPTALRSLISQCKGLVMLQERGHTRSHSPVNLLGLIALTPGDPSTVGDLLVHEASHIRLNLMRQFDPLWHDLKPRLRHRSPWRPDLRPLRGIVFGIHAFLNVSLFHKRVATWNGGDARSEMLFERQKQKVRSAWDAAQPYIKPTRLGDSFFAEMEKEVLAL